MVSDYYAVVLKKGGTHATISGIGASDRVGDVVGESAIGAMVLKSVGDTRITLELLYIEQNGL